MKNLDFYDITIVLPLIPPSINDLYFNNKRTGGRSLTKEGNIFKLLVKQHIANNYIEDLQGLNPNGVYSMDMFFYLSKEEVFTKTYPKAISAFQKKDVGNLEKILVDCIREVSMRDDCQIFSESLVKYVSPNKRVEVRLREVPVRYFISELPQEEQIDIINKVGHYRNKGKINGLDSH